MLDIIDSPSSSTEDLIEEIFAIADQDYKALKNKRINTSKALKSNHRAPPYHNPFIADNS